MIHLREEVLKQAEGLDYLLIKYGFTDVPRYVFYNIQEFTSNRDVLRVNESFVIPGLVYHPDPQSTVDVIHLPFKLRDKSGELEVWARDGAYNREMGKFLADSLAELNPGEQLVYAILRNGCVGQTIFDDGGDNGIYLAGFWCSRTRRPKSKPSDLVAKLRDLIPDLSPLPEPIPVRI